MAIPNFDILELCVDGPRAAEIVTEPWTLDGHRLLVPDRPGLGVELDVEALLDQPPRRIAVPSEAYAADGSVRDV
jgi:L-alanine-DL-glutamate epimerase-like enolase superfamily enzyme